MTYGRLGDLFVFLRYPEQLQGPMRELDAQMETALLSKTEGLEDLATSVPAAAKQKLTGEDKPVSDRNEVKKCGGCPC